MLKRWVQFGYTGYELLDTSPVISIPLDNDTKTSIGYTTEYTVTFYLLYLLARLLSTAERNEIHRRNTLTSISFIFCSLIHCRAKRVTNYTNTFKSGPAFYCRCASSGCLQSRPPTQNLTKLILYMISLRVLAGVPAHKDNNRKLYNELPAFSEQPQ